MLCKEHKYKLNESARTELTDGFLRLIKSKKKNFSNGRIVRKIFERVRMKQALRANNNIISGEDILSVFSETDIAGLLDKKSHTPIGFSA
jgi:hypothetical protein